MSLALCLRGIEAGAFENDVYAELAPRKVLSLGLRIDGDFLSVNDDGTGGYDGLAVLAVNGGLNVDSVEILADPSAVAALSGIILEKMREHLGVGEVVDGNDLVAGSVEHLAESKTSDSSEAVDCNFY